MVPPNPNRIVWSEGSGGSLKDRAEAFALFLCDA
jgi:hypothetical protein